MIEVHTKLDPQEFTELYSVAIRRILTLQSKSKIQNSREVLLENEPIIDSKYFKELEIESSLEYVFAGVELKDIVGRPFADNQKGGWSFEYENRKGRILEIVGKIKNATAENVSALVDSIFHPKEENERIKLIKINGKAGPIFSVLDGTHRIAGCKKAGLEIIPAEYKEIKYPVLVQDSISIKVCRQLKGLGFLTGNLNDKGFFEVQSEDFPWLRISSPNDRKKISEVYEKAHPNSLSGLSIPREIFFDQIAYNFFAEGKFEEWKDKQNK
jgi:hypothetical protein